jgi:hypothetical protein
MAAGVQQELMLIFQGRQIQLMLVNLVYYLHRINNCSKYDIIFTITSFLFKETSEFYSKIKLLYSVSMKENKNQNSNF